MSVVIVTHNAFRYCVRLFRSLPRTVDVRYEVVVVDNCSRWPTRRLLCLLRERSRIHQLRLMATNTLFAAGNNTGAQLSHPDAGYVLLLNSDVEVRDPRWLSKLLAVHARGATGLGYLPEPVPRADGFCLLIDRDLYLYHQLDESHQWWWSVTKLEAALLRDGASVQAVREYEQVLMHFGGKSGRRGFRKATGQNVSGSELYGWFSGLPPVTVIDRL